MPRSVDLDLPDWLRQFVVAGYLLAMLLVGALAIVQVFVGGTLLFERADVLAGLGALWLVLTVAWVRWARRQESSGSVWNAIPQSQYVGRFAEGGGLTRRDQERALPDDEES